jgi:hypothetical protein
VVETSQEPGTLPNLNVFVGQLLLAQFKRLSVGIALNDVGRTCNAGRILHRIKPVMRHGIFSVKGYHLAISDSNAASVGGLFHFKPRVIDPAPTALSPMRAGQAKP